MKHGSEIYPEQDGLNGIVMAATADIYMAQKELKPHRHRDAVEIVYIARGVQVYEVEGKCYEVQGGEVFLTYENELHSTGRHNEEISSLQWVQIHLSRPDGFLGLGREDAQKLIAAIRQIPRRHFKGDKSLQEMILKSIEVYQSDNPLKEVIVNNQIIAFLLRVIELAGQNRKSRITEDIRRTMEYIEENYQKPIRLAELSEVAILSESRFKMKFREQAGMPPGEFILVTRIGHCRERLRNTDETVKKICLANGFDSEVYFARAFKKIAGMTPLEYRRQQRLQNPST